MNEESERVESILTFISDYLKTEGTSPTVREIGDSEDLASTSSVIYWLKTLETWGYITRTPKRFRHIKLTPAGLKRIGLTEVAVR